MSDGAQAVVRETRGELVHEDQVAEAVFRALDKRSCEQTLRQNAHRIAYFRYRLAKRQLSPANTVIVLINVDDVHGGPLATRLMPDADWQKTRDRGMVPYAHGLAGREGIQTALDSFDEPAAAKLQGITDDLAVVVVDYGVAEVFAA